MAKRITMLLLVLIMALGSLTSCFIVINDMKTDGGNNNTSQTDSGKGKEEFPEKVDVFGKSQKSAREILDSSFSGINMEEARFSIVIADDVDISIQAEQETSYSKAITIQRDLISKKLNCELYINRMAYTTFLSDAQAAKNTGLFYADLVCVPQKAIGYMRARDMVADLNQLYGDIFTEDYFYDDSKSQASGNNSLYGIAGKGSVTPEAYGCVYFNKTVTDYYEITDQIYACIDDGSWTLDKMLEIKASCDGAHLTAPLIAANDTSTLVRSLFTSSGLKYISAGVGTKPAVADNGDKLTALITKLKTMFSDGSCGYGDYMQERFEQEGVMFYIGTLENASLIKGSYGIMPLPKLDASQERYYTYGTEDAKVYAVLTTNDRPQYVPNVLKAVNATGELLQVGWARDLLDYAFRDSKSYSVARIIFDSASYDFAYMYGESYPSVAESTYLAVENAVVSSVSYADSIKKTSAQFTKDITTLFP